MRKLSTDKDTLVARCECGHDVAALAIQMSNDKFKYEKGKAPLASLVDAYKDFNMHDGTWDEKVGTSYKISYAGADGAELLSAPSEVGKYVARLTYTDDVFGTKVAEFPYEIYAVAADEEDEDEGVKTGDTANLMLYIMLGLMTAAGAAFVLKRREN